MIGSHNTMSYLKPINFLGKITKFWGKCQDKTIEEQYEAGANYFDIRVKQIKNVWHFVHNNIDYGSIWTNKNEPNFVFKFIGENQIPIRLIYDQRKTPKYEEYEKGLFINLINTLTKDYHIEVDSAITFWDWKEYITAEKKEIIEYHASVSAKWYQYIFGTKLFAKARNTHFIYTYSKELISDEKVLLIDYI